MKRKLILYKSSLWAIICLILIINLLTGCAKEHKLRAIHFKPAPPPEIPSRELPPVPTASPIQAIRVANSYFIEAKESLQKGDRKTAQEKYLIARRTLISGGIVPGIFSELNEFWEKEMLPETEKRINLETTNTYKIIERLKGSSPYDSIKFPFPVPEQVLYEIQDAQTRYPDRFQEGLDRSGYYVPHLREAFRKAGLPQELCWLAMVESMYKLKAYSSAGAAGMWQFIRSTGEHYNMRINSYIDERYNWVIATNRAIDYLKHLYGFFGGSWELAISAYNMGEGNLIRTIEATGGERSFWRLLETPPATYRMKDETKKYFPRFLAYILICNDPVPYGFSPSPHQPIKWDEIDVQGMYAIDILDSAMGYTPGTLASWNPFLVRGTTPPNGCKMMLPAGDGKKLLALLSNPDIKQAEVMAYTVRKGETAYHIAKRYGVSVNELLKMNGLNTVKSVRAGMEILVPISKRGYVSFAKNETRSKVEQQIKDFHIVQKGETLFSISKKYEIEVENLARWNNIKGDQRLKIGDKISLKPILTQTSEISETLPQNETIQTKNIYYAVKKGDTISSIAKAYSTKPEKIMEMNNLSAKSVLRVGQRLIVGTEAESKTIEEKPMTASNKIPKENPISEVNNEIKMHEVQKGDTLSKIASTYKIDLNYLKQWNQLDNSSVLQIGQKIYLYNPEQQNIIKPPTERLDGGIYIVKQGDTLSKIAKENSVNVKTIMELNNLNESSRLQIGQKIVLSRNMVTDISNTSDDISKEKIPTQKKNSSVGFVIYHVQPGDNLWSIAQKNNISVNELTQWNNLDIAKQLKIGQELKIYSTVEKKDNQEKKIQVSAVSISEKPQTSQKKDEKQSVIDIYRVQKGDSLYTISKKVGVPLKELMEINNLNDTKVLQVGEIIRIKK